jgi:hypothetical protein
MTLSKTLLLAGTCLALAACATAPTPTTKVASTNAATRTDAGPAGAPAEFKGLYSQSWVKDEDAKDKSGPDGLARR